MYPHAPSLHKPRPDTPGCTQIRFAGHQKVATRADSPIGGRSRCWGRLWQAREGIMPLTALPARLYRQDESTTVQCNL